MKRLYNKLVNVEKDKLLHFIVMFIITLIIYGVAAKITHSKVSAIGIAKEAYDEHKHHDAEEGDWVSDMVGCVSALAYCLILL